MNAANGEAHAPHTYWEAQGLAELALGEFEGATQRGDTHGQQSAFYHVARYYARTLGMVRNALAERNEPLAQATLRNLVTLHRPLTRMHRAAPQAVPLALALDEAGRGRMVRDLLVRVLAESPEPLEVAEITQRVNALDLLRDLTDTMVRRHLHDLVASGYAARTENRYARSNLTYTELDLDDASLEMMSGKVLYERFRAAGFRGLADVQARQSFFREQFPALAGLSPATADLLIQAARTLLDTGDASVSPWRHADLLGSRYPRPYQYEAYAVFRGHGYKGQLVEAPTGSGKTMVGMLCLQDWLRSMRTGQSVLVLVPTAVYQQQWTNELCYKPIGLRLSPEVVFSGTPAQLERFQRRTGLHPAVILLTYTSLAQLGSAVGKGGYDADSIEIFLQGANIQYVILDEVHKVVEDMQSVSAQVTRHLVDWLRDGSLRGLIGFTGTAAAYRPRFAELGLELAHTIPVADLIAYGFVAPFGEYGLPFANSARERRIRELLDAYKRQLREYYTLLGSERLRGWLAEIPLPERMRIGHDLLGMYRGRADAAEALAARLTAWEQGGALGVPEAPLVLIVQSAHGWTDQELVRQAGADPARFAALRQQLETIRQELLRLIYLPRSIARLQAGGYTTRLDVEGLRRLPEEVRAATARVERAKDLLATTIVGLYEGLADWYLRVGEGRVDMVRAILAAEGAARPVTGVIVFDNAKRIPWRQGIAVPGYEGVGGLFAQLLGDPRLRILAALSNEMYLSHNPAAPLPPRIAAFVEQSIMLGEIGGALFSLFTQGLEPTAHAAQVLPVELWEKLRQQLAELLAAYLPRMAGLHQPRLGDFARHVLSPLRRAIRKARLGLVGERLLGRLDLRNIHLNGLVLTFFDYAALADDIRQARLAELQQADGTRQSYYLLPMPGGHRKQLMYDLTARLVDAESVGINLVIVSSWARTGWNVIQPNVLIDATATRDVTAWQQLRGRAMRALGTWSNDCYRLILGLAGCRAGELAAQADLPEDIARTLHEMLAERVSRAVEPAQMRLIEAIASPECCARVAHGGLAALTDQERLDLAVALMLARNKVTHIYELIKAYGGGSQVEYDRQRKRWQRREAIALKHEHESAVQPFTGELVRGVAHAPLLYAADPRNDLPADLQRLLQVQITGRDGMIVEGWLQPTMEFCAGLEDAG